MCRAEGHRRSSGTCCQVRDWVVVVRSRSDFERPHHRGVMSRATSPARNDRRSMSNWTGRRRCLAGERGPSRFGVGLVGPRRSREPVALLVQLRPSAATSQRRTWRTRSGQRRLSSVFRRRWRRMLLGSSSRVARCLQVTHRLVLHGSLDGREQGCGGAMNGLLLRFRLDAIASDG